MPQNSLYQLLILEGLQRKSHVYAGTARGKTAASRVKNRLARKARRFNRGV